MPGQSCAPFRAPHIPTKLIFLAREPRRRTGCGGQERAPPFGRQTVGLNDDRPRGGGFFTKTICLTGVGNIDEIGVANGEVGGFDQPMPHESIKGLSEQAAARTARPTFPGFSRTCHRAGRDQRNAPRGGRRSPALVSTRRANRSGHRQYRNGRHFLEERFSLCAQTKSVAGQNRRLNQPIAGKHPTNCIARRCGRPRAIRWPNPCKRAPLQDEYPIAD